MDDPYAVDTKDVEIPERPPRYFRLPLCVAIRANTPDGRSVASGVRLVSLSASGIGLVPAIPLEVGDRIHVEFDIREPGAALSVPVHAEVVRVVDDDFELYVGCRFVGFGARVQQRLLAALEALRDLQTGAA